VCCGCLGCCPRTLNPLKLLWWSLTGRVRKAKALLASKVSGDLSGVHATGIALHNIVNSFQLMRTLFGDISQRTTLSSEEVSRRCVLAPASVLRQATDAGKVTGCPFGRLSLFIVALGEAQRKYGSEDVIFLKNSWSRCPAEQWVPALLEGVWRRAIENS